ncbi:ABC transporter permease [Candidatus Bipolaricaulota bacterium]|nr:ABC transporter permease [Candidatus Bipolaricaulota bacterium]
MYYPSSLRKSISIAKKDLLIYYGKGPVVIFGILLPFFFFFSFLIGREMPPLSLISGLGGMAIWFTATSISPVIAPMETRTRTLERLVSMPISVTEMLMGDILASMTMGAVLSAVPISIIATILGLNLELFLPLFLGIVLASFCFSAIGVLMSALPTDTPSDVMMLALLIKFPVVFVSGVFIPASNLPGWGRAISRFSPLTYFVDIVRASFGGSGQPWLDVGVLSLFSVFFLFAAVIVHEKTLPKRL